MHTRLLNLGFVKRGDEYVCEDIVVSVTEQGDKLLIHSLGEEVTLRELETLLLDYL